MNNLINIRKRLLICSMLCVIQYSIVDGQTEFGRPPSELELNETDLAAIGASFDTKTLVNSELGRLLLCKPVELRITDNGREWEIKRTPGSHWDKLSADLGVDDLKKLYSAIEATSSSKLRIDQNTKKIINIAELGDLLNTTAESNVKNGYERRLVKQAKIGADVRRLGITGMVSPVKLFKVSPLSKTQLARWK